VLTAESCHHCGYRIPQDASICPGCGRRHSSIAPRLEDHPQRRSPLLRDARWVRRLVTATGWLGLALALTAGARLVAGIDRVAEELDDDALLRVDHGGRLVAVSLLLCLGGTALAVAAFVRRTRQNSIALGLDRRGARAWSLPGWLLPGRPARQAKAEVDQVWRSSSPLVGALPRRGSSRRLVSRVVLRWWSLWLWAPAAGTVAVLANHADDGALAEERGVAAIAAGALLVAFARALYDVVGIITVAHAHAGERVLQARADLPWDAPWDEDEATEARETEGTEGTEPGLEPLAR
jgi:hypothetical protein